MPRASRGPDFDALRKVAQTEDFAAQRGLQNPLQYSSLSPSHRSTEYDSSSNGTTPFATWRSANGMLNANARRGQGAGNRSQGPQLSRIEETSSQAAYRRDQGMSSQQEVTSSLDKSHEETRARAASDARARKAEAARQREETNVASRARVKVAQEARQRRRDSVRDWREKHKQQPKQSPSPPPPPPLPPPAQAARAATPSVRKEVASQKQAGSATRSSASTATTLDLSSGGKVSISNQRQERLAETMRAETDRLREKRDEMSRRLYGQDELQAAGKQRAVGVEEEHISDEQVNAYRRELAQESESTRKTSARIISSRNAALYKKIKNVSARVDDDVNKPPPSPVRVRYSARSFASEEEELESLRDMLIERTAHTPPSEMRRVVGVATAQLRRMDDGVNVSVAELHNRDAEEERSAAAAFNRATWDKSPAFYMPPAVRGMRPVTKEPWNHGGEVDRFVPSYGLDGELLPAPTEKPPMTGLANSMPTKSFSELNAATTSAFRGKRRPRRPPGAQTVAAATAALAKQESESSQQTQMKPRSKRTGRDSDAGPSDAGPDAALAGQDFFVGKVLNFTSASSSDEIPRGGGRVGDASAAAGAEAGAQVAVARDPDGARKSSLRPPERPALNEDVIAVAGAAATRAKGVAQQEDILASNRALAPPPLNVTIARFVGSIVGYGVVRQCVPLW